MQRRHPQHSGIGNKEPTLQMTPRAQELFLAYAHFCGERGVEPLIPIVKQAVINAVSGIELSAKLGADQILQVFSDAHTSEFSASCKGHKQPLPGACLLT